MINSTDLNGACAPNGRLGVSTGSGNSYICSNNIWKQIGTSSTIVGGIMGGFFGATLAAGNVLAPWAGGGTGTYGMYQSIPFTAWFHNLSVVTTNAASNGTRVAFRFFASDFAASNTINAPIESTYVLPGQAAGAFGEMPGSSPFLVPLLQGIYVGGYGVNNSSLALAGFSWDLVGSTSQPLGWYRGLGQIAGNTTIYAGPSQKSVTTNTTEAISGVIIPYDGTLKTLCFVPGGNQPATGSLVLTLNLTHAGVTSGTALTITINAGTTIAGSTVFCDLMDTVAVSAGDWIDWKIANNASTTSPYIYSISTELVPTGTATGMIVWGLGQQTITNGQYDYFPPFASAALTTTETNARGPIPRAVTMKNLSCIYTTPPGTNPAVVTVMKNGVESALTVSIPTTGAGTQIIRDTTHTVNFAKLDTFDLEIYQVSGTNPAISSCSVEVD